MSSSDVPSLALVGAGLHNAVIALAALQARPDARIVLLERAERPAGNHTWSFHQSDVPESLRALAGTLAEHSWPDYDVRFPERSRRMGLGYASLSSAHLTTRLHEAFARAPHAVLRTGVEVVRASSDGVTLAGGEHVPADLVIDARGPGPDSEARCGYQKFYGIELALDAPHGLDRPLLMDATVEQIDGFRFLYVLPFGPTRLLVEDTVFSANPQLEDFAWRARVIDEAHARGWSTQDILREERGVLPMPWAGSGPDLQRTGPLRAGYAGRWFHPATGYSMPQAFQVAQLVAQQMHAPSQLFASPAYRSLVKRFRRQARFARFLNRLLFTGVAPQWQWSVFQRFYGLSESAIARFYRCALRPTDRARMLVGRPPRGFSIRRTLVGSAAE